MENYNLTTDEIIEKYEDGEVTYSQLLEELKQSTRDKEELNDILKQIIIK